MIASKLAASAALVVVLVSTGACGKRGDPLAPMRLFPAPVTELSGRRAAQAVELRFTLPTANAQGVGPIDLERVEVYAVTVAAGAITPPNRDILTKARIVGAIPVKPPPVEGGPTPEPTPEDKRPSAGDAVTFVEELTEATLKPTPGLVSEKAAPVTVPESAAPVIAGLDPQTAAIISAIPGGTITALPGSIAPATTAAETPAAGAATPVAAPPVPPVPAAPVVSPYPLRIYVVRGISRSGRPGPPSTRVSIPLVSPVAPPTAVAATMPSENGVVIDWTPPVAEPGAAPLTFSVYRRESPATPLNPKPLTDAKFEMAGLEYGKEQCFVVRSIQAMQNVTVESDVSAPACLTPLDKFPPASPKNLRAVAEDGAVNLVWDQNTDADLAGYVVLRDDGAGGTLQPVTAQPIKEANYRDTTIKPGLRYTYALVAVDTATPPNASAPSAPEAVTTR